MYKKLQFYFLLILLIGVIILTAFIFYPFLISLFLAAVFAFIFQSLYKKILSYIGNKMGLAAFFSTIIITILVLVPLIFFGIQIFQEASQLYNFFTENSKDNVLINASKGFIDGFQELIPASKGFFIDINQYLKQAFNFFIQNLDSLFASFTKIMINIFIFLIALFYMFKDGDNLKKNLVKLSPLSNVDDEMISEKLGIAVTSVVKGSIVIAVIQGVLTSIGLSIFGVPNAIFWGSMAMITALIPGIGTAFIILPAIVFLLLNNELFASLGLFLWGVVIVGVVDNFLGPKLVSEKTKLHPLIIILSVIGGIMFFGPIGFLLGPIILSLLFALLDIYSSVIKDQI